ncbi:MAG: DoxX family protein [Rhodothermales bacterium]
MKKIIFALERILESQSYLGLLLLRLFVGARLFYGVIDNILSWDQMVEFSVFLDNFGFPAPMVSAVISVYVQFFGSMAILLGYKIRLASLFMIANFLIALAMVHFPAGDTFEAMTPPLAMLFGSIAFLFLGAGKASLDRR